MKVHVGTSGWVYNHWRGLFYPDQMRQSDWFGFYAREFETVELNNSFYRLPTASAFEKWGKDAPDGFIFAVKASRFLTHLKKLKEPEEPLKTFFARVEKLGKKLGPILYQLPPRWNVNMGRFEHFLSALPEGHKHVVEFRDQSWLVEDVFKLMERHGVSHCIHDMPPLEVPLRVTAQPVYIRFHGGKDYAGNYPAEVLNDWARRIEDLAGKNGEVFVYFNNDAGGFAVENARTLRAMKGL